MNKKGFTLVELIVVIAIVATASVLLATNFTKLTGKQDDFEDKVVAKNIAEAAYVYYKNEAGDSCITGAMLINNGYIAPKAGLLKDYTEADLKKFCAKYNSSDNSMEVYKMDSCNCTGSPIDYED